MTVNESVSDVYTIDATVASTDENIAFDDLVGQLVTIDMALPAGGTRYFNGHVSRFCFAGIEGELALYELTMKPFLWSLTRATDCRIFQNKTVPDIIKDVCSGYGFTDIDDRLTGAYQEWEYCVQFGETSFDFVSRLMEHEGIYYFFEHAENKHTLVLADDYSAHHMNADYDAVPFFLADNPQRRNRDHIHHWRGVKTLQTCQFTHTDYDFTKPKASLEARSKVSREHDLADFEQYEYPGRYTEHHLGESIARRRIEAEQAQHEQFEGKGNARGLIPGYLMELFDHPRTVMNQEYLLLSVQHHLTLNDYASGDSEDGFNYECLINAMPSAVVYKCLRKTKKPIIQGPQTATVVGPSGEEIWTDKYGRVKVSFR